MPGSIFPMIGVKRMHRDPEYHEWFEFYEQGGWIPKSDPEYAEFLKAFRRECLISDDPVGIYMEFAALYTPYSEYLLNLAVDHLKMICDINEMDLE